MKIFRIALVIVALVAISACSDKSSEAEKKADANDKPRQESEVAKSGDADGSRSREGSDCEGESSEKAANLEVEERPEDY